ncbi:hypothetical protein EZS27_032895, partial [termite gut metagenome]
MKKRFRLLTNVIILLIVSGFVWYMISTLNEGESTYAETVVETETFVSPYSRINSFDVSGKINGFDLSEDKLYIASRDSVLILDLQSNYLSSFAAGNDICDITVENSLIYLLFPTRIEVFTADGQQVNTWEACSDNSN